jgi:hydrogenase maturation protease
VDALRRGARPGTVHRLDHDELLAVRQPHAHAHRLSLPESLRWLALAFPDLARVRYRFWGIEPGEVSPREGLSPAVAEAVGRVAEEIIAAG